MTFSYQPPKYTSEEINEFAVRIFDLQMSGKIQVASRSKFKTSSPREDDNKGSQSRLTATILRIARQYFQTFDI